MSGLEAVKKIVAPFLTHGICKDEDEALKMLADDYVKRQVGRYQERAEHFRSFYRTSVEQFAEQVAALCEGSGGISSLANLDKQQQIVRAEDDLEEWQAAEQFLVRWQAVETDLQNASAP